MHWGPLGAFLLRLGLLRGAWGAEPEPEHGAWIWEEKALMVDRGVSGGCRGRGRRPWGGLCSGFCLSCCCCFDRR